MDRTQPNLNFQTRKLNRITVNAIENELISDKRKSNKLKKQKEDNLIKAAIEKQLTRLMANKLQLKNSIQAITTINNLIIPEHIKSKLTRPV
jgi:hypothetical protein